MPKMNECPRSILLDLGLLEQLDRHLFEGISAECPLLLNLTEVPLSL
jgi:hypothetical protein